ncbi:hypothetical protein QBC47DRAFT_361334 [Echria macrotheca]|uniref:RBR-type E3 ubiquitin transferase n=1 Tax=Echria macrotheca TaxID=438768 RepID=A0AAJ0BCH8_9PEZI|nr:hypothetical protein QBC47DRAFT_361334 [Echria macrotheca]
MARNESERHSRSSEPHGTARALQSEEYRRTLSRLFGSRPSTAHKRRRSAGQYDRDRDRDREQDRNRDWDWPPSSQPDRDLSRDVGRASRKTDTDKDRGHNRDTGSSRPNEKKHHRKHQEYGREEEGDGAPKLRRRKHRHSTRERELVEVELLALDHRGSDLKIGVPRGCVVRGIESCIRRWYLERNKLITPTAEFLFFSDGQPLGLTDVIQKRPGTIWYRVTKSPGEAESWRFTHWQDETNGRLDSALSGVLAKAIDDGVTVRQLRKMVAGLMNVNDPYRIVLSTRDGMRRGLIQGEDWEAKRMKKWLTCWLSVDINPEKYYVVLRGLGREYVYHPQALTVEQGMDTRKLALYMSRRLFRSACMLGTSKFDLSSMEIKLFHDDGRCAGPLTPLEWGATYTFEIPQDAAEAFADEENWLLQPTESCAVCMEDKKITELPIRITSDCQHPSVPCKDCLKQWLQSSLERATWDRIKCPDCPAILGYADMRRYASRETFSRFDTLSTRSAVEALPNFRWCLSATCGSGQIEDQNCAKSKCQACGAKQCMKHNVPWHKGETCEEYDRRNKQRKKDDKASEQTIKKITKKCPECVCGHEWCYICFARFQRNEHGFLYCHHAPECTERDPFVDLIDPIRANRLPAFGIPPPPRFANQDPFMRPFMPQHLRRHHANGPGGGGGGAGAGPGGGGAPFRRPPPPRPPPGFPFRGQFDANGNPLVMGRHANLQNLQEAAAAMTAEMHRVAFVNMPPPHMQQQDQQTHFFQGNPPLFHQDLAEGGLPQEFAGLRI